VSTKEYLDNLEHIKKIDSSGMLETVGKTPELFQNAYDIFAKVSLQKLKKFKDIVVLGMGGSAIGGDIAANLLFDKADIPLSVNRGNKIPAYVNKSSLVIAISYSGNTEETLSAVNAAGRVSAQVICVTSGGELEKIARAKKYPVYVVPAGYQPRAALPYLLVALLKILENIGLFNNLEKELGRAIALLKKLKSDYDSSNSMRSNPVKQLAAKIVNKTPIIFASRTTSQAAGLRLKTQLNENSKVPALFNLFPELDHNEIVGLAGLKRAEHNYCLIILRDEKDSERLKKRIEITKSLIVNQIGGASEINAQGKTMLERVLSLILFADYLSVYLAILRGVDPTPVDVITRLKKEMAR